MSAHTYMLRCSDGSYYVGSTVDIELRITQHARGQVASTRSRRPVCLVWSEEHDRIDEAWEVERRLHGWSRAKKEALAAGDWTFLKGYSSRSRAIRARRLP